MAHNFFDGVMTFLGLVDADDNNNKKNKNNGRNSDRSNGSNDRNNGKNNRNASDDGFDGIDRTRNVKNSRSGKRYDDDFDDEPRVTYTPRSGRTASVNNASGRGQSVQQDDFDADDIWGGTSRPEYGGRSGSSVQSGTRSSRYNPQGSSRSTSAYDAGYRAGNTRRDANYYGGENDMNRNNDQYGTQYSTQNTGAKHQMAMFRIKTVDECKNVIRTLLEKKSVLLSLEEMDSVQAQRVVDTMSGATFAIGAKMNRASARSWLLTPSTVEVDDKHAISSNTIL